MSFFDCPQRISRPSSYFAATNSHRGFVSYFPTLFAPYRKLIIKGGPGSGKSTLMKKFAHAALQKGLLTERYYCSSDTDSLDAVALPQKSTVILDGTPPHATEPECPGAKDSLLDLTAFWDEALLKSNLNEITLINRDIALSYKRVYTLMQGVESVRRSVKEATRDAFRNELCQKLINRLLDKYRIMGNGKGQGLIRPELAFGAKGYVAFPSSEEKAKVRIFIKDRAVFKEHFFALLQETLLARGIRFYVSPYPITEETAAVYLPQSGILFSALLSEETADGVINLDRVLKNRGKAALSGQKSLLRVGDLLCREIESVLRHIGKRHDELETYYIEAIDHTALNQYTEQLLTALFP